MEKKGFVYIKRFTDKQKAENWLDIKKESSIKQRYALIDGPENDYAVVDLYTAIEMGCGYIF